MDAERLCGHDISLPISKTTRFPAARAPVLLPAIMGCDWLLARLDIDSMTVLMLILMPLENVVDFVRRVAKS